MIERNPMQPLVLDEAGTIRFKENALVRYLLDFSKINLNDLAVAADRFKFSQDDQEQFAQLIGYSLSGFHELSYVSDETALAASKVAEEKWPNRKFEGCRDVECEIHSGVGREP